MRQLSLNYFDLEKLEDFLALNKKSLGIAQALKHRTEEARCLNNIGLYYFKANRYSKALTLYENALQILRDTGYYPEDTADCLNNIALIHLSLGGYDKALRYLQEAIAVDNILKNDSGMCIGLNNIGEILRNRARTKRTLSMYTEAIDIFRKL